MSEDQFTREMCDRFRKRVLADKYLPPLPPIPRPEPEQDNRVLWELAAGIAIVGAAFIVAIMWRIAG
jgi:hypothetical protein